jgi:ubiquinone/menaquinone biosynthesis C-methylase UbiE
MEVRIPKMSVGNMAIQLASKTPRKKSKLNSILKNLPKLEDTDKCLDIGTAHGGLAYFFSKKGNWSFVDSNQDNLTVARTILKGEFYQQDALYFLESNNGFSLITCFDTIMYFDNTNDALIRFSNALEPNGYLALTITNSNDRKILIRIRKHLGLEKAHLFKVNLTPNDLIGYLPSVGLKIVTYSTFCGFFTELLQTILDYSTSKKKFEQNGLVPNLSKLYGKELPKFWQLRIINFLSVICNALDYLLPGNSKFGYLIIAEKTSS